MSGTSDLILVIDDDLQIARFLTTALEAEGYSVIEANRGEDGVDLASVHNPALILLDMVLPDMDGFEVCRRISHDLSLKHIPVIALTAHDTARARLTEAIDSIDDYIFKPFDVTDLLTRVKLSLKRTRSMTESSPLTGLPGNVAIQDELMKKIDQKRRFALLYVDLDEFKAFNDHYGFLRGDEAIKLLARCVSRTMQAHTQDNSFLGHIGGDDFIVMIEPELSEPLAKSICEGWDSEVSGLYDDADGEKGYIEVADRRSQVHKFPLMTVSIGIVTNVQRRIENHWQAVEVATEMKQFAKQDSGSSFAVDRRRETG